MNWEAISAVAEVLGALAVVLSLLALWHQMKQNTRALNASIVQSAMDGVNDVNRFLHGDAETSSLVRKGIVDPDALDDDEAFRFDILMRYYVNHNYKLFRLYEQGVFPRKEWMGTAQEFAQVMSTSGGQRFRQVNHFYDDLWSEIATVETKNISAFQFGRESRVKGETSGAA